MWFLFVWWQDVTIIFSFDSLRWPFSLLGSTPTILGGRGETIYLEKIVWTLTTKSKPESKLSCHLPDQPFFSQTWPTCLCCPGHKHTAHIVHTKLSYVSVYRMSQFVWLISANVKLSIYEDLQMNHWLGFHASDDSLWQYSSLQKVVKIVKPVNFNKELHRF